MRLVLFLLCGFGVLAHAKERVVSAGGGVTEIVYALGAESQLVGVDTSSVYPEEATSLPQVGYARALSAEGLLSLSPSLLLCYEEAGPPATLQQIEDAGVRIVKLPSEPDADNLELRIHTIAEALGASEKAPALVTKVRMELQEALNTRSALSPRVLFIYARAGGILNVSGTDTHADAMIRLAGGKNAVEGFKGYKPLTAEAAVVASPDVILVTSRGLEDAGGKEALLQHPGLARTPAAKAGRVVVMDDLLLLGFGPRLGQAVRELTRLIQAPASSNSVSAKAY